MDLKIDDCPNCGYFTDDWYGLSLSNFGDTVNVECFNCHSDLEILLLENDICVTSIIEVGI